MAPRKKFVSPFLAGTPRAAAQEEQIAQLRQQRGGTAKQAPVGSSAGGAAPGMKRAAAEAVPQQQEQQQDKQPPLKTARTAVTQKRRGFVAPTMRAGNIPKASAGANLPVPADLPSSELEHESHFRCLHTRRSNKKHKTWDDGFLVTLGGKCRLLDDEGKQLSQSLSYSRKTLSGLTDGSTLEIGNREVEVGGPVDEELFLSGRIFLKAAPVPKAARPPAIRKTGVARLLTSSSAQRPGLAAAGAARVGGAASASIKARFDPDLPDAIVLYRPLHAKNQCAVVVDPHVARELREHQRFGVQFLFNSLCGLSTRNSPSDADRSSDPDADAVLEPASSEDMVGGAILADEMGLGKTLQAIAIIWTLLKQSPFGSRTPVVDAARGEKIVIITPSSLVKNWMAEINKWLKSTRLRPIVVKDDKKKLNEETVSRFVDSSGDVSPLLIISYEQLNVHRGLIVDAVRSRRMKVGLVVCDEAHRLKNRQTVTARAILEMRPLRRLLLTGTPVQNDMDEFFALCDFAIPAVLGSEKSFRTNFSQPITNALALGRKLKLSDKERRQKMEGDARSVQLKTLTSSFMLRRDAKLLQRYLPPKIDHVVCCNPSPLQIRLYKDFLKGGRVSQVMRSLTQGRGAGGDNQADALSCLIWLRKLCNHPALLNLADDDDVAVPEVDAAQWQPEHSGKLQMLERMLLDVRSQNPDDRCVLVSQSTKTLDYLQKMCAAHSWTFVRLDGQTPANVRQELVERFNRQSTLDNLFLFLLSAKAGGVGLNLIGGNRLFMLDPDWNPSVDKQAMARVWREGQAKTTYLYRLLTTGTLEEKIFQRQIIKDALSDSVMTNSSGSSSAASSGGSMAFSAEDLREVFNLNVETTSETHDLLFCSRCGTQEKVPMSARQRSSHKGEAMANAEIARIWNHLDADQLRDSEVDLDPCLLHTHSGPDSTISFVFSLTTDPSAQQTLVKPARLNNAKLEPEDAEGDISPGRSGDEEAPMDGADQEMKNLEELLEEDPKHPSNRQRQWEEEKQAELFAGL